MQTNCTLLAKVTVNAKLQTVRVLFTFDKYNKVTVRNAVLATGDLCSVDDANIDLHIAQAVQRAKALLQTNNVQVLD